MLTRTRDVQVERTLTIKLAIKFVLVRIFPSPSLASLSPMVRHPCGPNRRVLGRRGNELSKTTVCSRMEANARRAAALDNKS